MYMCICLYTDVRVCEDRKDSGGHMKDPDDDARNDDTHMTEYRPAVMYAYISLALTITQSYKR